MTSLGSLFSRNLPSNPITNIVSFFIWRASPVSVLCRAVTDCPLIAAHEAAQWYLYIYIVLCIQLIVTSANLCPRLQIARLARDTMTAQLEEIPSLESLLAAAKDLFRQRFGRDATAGAAAPGRVNLIGDYACTTRSETLIFTRRW